LAAPTPVQEGDVILVRPKHLHPVHPDTPKDVGRHPAIVVDGNPDAENKIKATLVSHHHPGNPPTKPAKEYGDFPDDPIKGESLVNVGPPKLVDVSQVKIGTQGQKIEASKLALLKSHINVNCPDGEKLTRRDGSCRMKPKTPTQTNKKSPAKSTAAMHVTGRIALPAKKIGGVRKPAMQRKKQAKTVRGARKAAVAALEERPVGQRKTGTGKK